MWPNFRRRSHTRAISRKLSRCVPRNRKGSLHLLGLCPTQCMQIFIRLGRRPRDSKGRKRQSRPKIRPDRFRRRRRPPRMRQPIARAGLMAKSNNQAGSHQRPAQRLGIEPLRTDGFVAGRGFGRGPGSRSQSRIVGPRNERQHNLRQCRRYRLQPLSLSDAGKARMIAARAISAGNTDGADGTDAIFGIRAHPDHSGSQPAFTRERDLDAERPAGTSALSAGGRQAPAGWPPMRRPSQCHREHTPRRNAKGLMRSRSTWSGRPSLHARRWLEGLLR